ncbi:hypothetical protein BOX37_27825 [Nocardia mangyaensis]|uniref:Uncharacterized protein n=1 Tax=Nocardia mangyaensis TaxID=2213200 RepID=A0A1J0VYE6_9NOCA|nr:hypothetical protein BOX37_27825 [Nocardia mangyaensis]
MAHAPVSAGLVVPYITLAHRDRTRPIWGRIDAQRRGEVLHNKRCQVCGEPLDATLVLMIRPSDYQRGVAVEPALHPECAWYSRRACVMLAGHVDRYNPCGGSPLNRCADPRCRCRFWTSTEDNDATQGREGKPAEAWYEAWIRFDDYRVFTVPADESGPAATGIALRRVPLLRLRKVRDPAPDGRDTEWMDILAKIVAARKLWNNLALGEFADNNPWLPTDPASSTAPSRR